MKFLILAVLPALALATGEIGDADVDVESRPVQFAIQKSTETLTTSLGLDGENVPFVSIASAKTQVVNGMNYFLTLQFGNGYFCDVTVWYRAYIDTPDALQLTEGPTCTQKSSAVRTLGGHGLVGGESEKQDIDTSDEDLMSLLKFASCAYNDEVNNMYASTHGDLSSATYTTQVTSGITYRFYNVPMVQTSCRNQGCGNFDETSCAAQDDLVGTCNFTVRFKIWQDPPVNLTDIQC